MSHVTSFAPCAENTERNQSRVEKARCTCLGLPVHASAQKIFLGFRIFSLGHGRFRSRSMDSWRWRADPLSARKLKIAYMALSQYQLHALNLLLKDTPSSLVSSAVFMEPLLSSCPCPNKQKPKIQRISLATTETSPPVEGLLVGHEQEIY